jgi:acyl-CoA hydrolase
VTEAQFTYVAIDDEGRPVPVYREDNPPPVQA